MTFKENWTLRFTRYFLCAYLIDNTSLLLNIANIPHCPDEAVKKELDEIEFDWRIL